MKKKKKRSNLEEGEQFSHLAFSKKKVFNPRKGDLEAHFLKSGLVYDNAHIEAMI